MIDTDGLTFQEIEAVVPRSVGRSPLRMQHITTKNKTPRLRRRGHNPPHANRGVVLFILERFCGGYAGGTDKIFTHLLIHFIIKKLGFVVIFEHLA